MKPRVRSHPGTTPEVVIVGAGIAGLCMAITLAKAGFESVTVLERGDSLGGTWRDNTYPGAACDVPSHLYCFSFEPNPGFSRRYSGQPEIRAYLEHCAERHDVRRKIRFGAAVTAARFDEARARWTVTLASGETLVTDVVIFATGQLSRPSVPAFEGASDFRGRTLHSARFAADYSARGRRVAVIGSGASAIQIVPAIAETAEHLVVFQRTPAYIVPRADRVYGNVTRSVFQRVPAALRAYRAAIYLGNELRFWALLDGSMAGEILVKMAAAHREAQVGDPALREALTPHYPVGCKRVLISDDYYPALQRPNVTLVTSPILRLTARGVRTQDGQEHAVDDVVYATGFDSTSFLAEMEITGREGRTLSSEWREGAEAYLGMTVPRFPNLFVLYGPNTNLGHNSIIFMLECQARYVRKCLERLRTGVRTLEVREDVKRRFNEELQAALARTTWAGDCSNWYKTASGKNTNNWSGPTLSYWFRTLRPDFRAFEET